MDVFTCTHKTLTGAMLRAVDSNKGTSHVPRACPHSCPALGSFYTWFFTSTCMPRTLLILLTDRLGFVIYILLYGLTFQFRVECALFFIVELRYSRKPSWLQTSNIAKDDFELLILWPPPPLQSWNYRLVSTLSIYVILCGSRHYTNWAMSLVQPIIYFPVLAKANLVYYFS